MNIIKIIVIAILFGIGCSATKLNYQPQEYKDISQSIEILKNSLKHQSPNHVVKSVEIKTDYLKIISGLAHLRSFNCQFPNISIS